MAAPAKPEDEDNPRRDGMWDSLPQDLLFLVFSLLSLSQLICAAAVCKFWLRTAAAAAANERRQLPWLLVTATDEFYSFSEDRLYRLQLPDDFLHGGYWASGVQGIHQDWFVFSSSSPTLVVDGKRLYPLVFYNPFSRRRIDLPPVPAGPRNYPHRSTSNIVFSSSPHDPACVAAFVRDKSQGIGFCNVAAAGSRWQMIPCRSEYRGIAFYQSSLYVTTPDGALHAVPTSTGLPEIQHLLPAPTWCGVPPHLKDDFLFRRICGGPNEGRSYSLVVSGDDGLLLVCFMGGDGVRSRTFTIAPIALYEANFKLGRWLIISSAKPCF